MAALRGPSRLQDVWVLVMVRALAQVVLMVLARGEPDSKRRSGTQGAPQAANTAQVISRRARHPAARLAVLERRHRTCTHHGGHGTRGMAGRRW